MNEALRLRTALVFCVVAFLSCARLLAQQPGDYADATPVIHATVNKVLVPVVVRDRQGHAVADLKQGDFEVFDNDKPHAISGFDVENHGAAGSTGSAQTAPAQAAAQNPASTPQPARRFVILLFDDFHLGIEELARTRKAAEKLIAGPLLDANYAAVVSISGKINSGLIRDRSRLLQALGSLQPQSPVQAGTNDCPSIDYYQADLILNRRDAPAINDAIQKVFSCDPGLDPKTGYKSAENLAMSAARRALGSDHQDTQASYATIAAVVHGMATLPGERTLVLISPGFLRIEQDEIATESRIVDLAAESNVTISALDARGVYTTEFAASERGPAQAQSGAGLQQGSDYRRSAMAQAADAMAELADGTGGTFFHNSNDLDAGFTALAEPPEVLYLLELSLDKVKQDGSYHRLKVKVNRDGVELLARRGYYMPKPEKSGK